MTGEVYIHYGADAFDPSHGFPVVNTKYSWVSPTEVYGHRENVRPTAGPNGARRIPFGIAPQNPHFSLSCEIRKK